MIQPYKGGGSSPNKQQPPLKTLSTANDIRTLLLFTDLPEPSKKAKG